MNGAEPGRRLVGRTWSRARTSRAGLAAAASLLLAASVGWWLHASTTVACAATSARPGGGIGLLVLADTPDDPLTAGWRLQLESEGVPATWHFLRGRGVPTHVLDHRLHHGIVVLPSAQRAVTRTRAGAAVNGALIDHVARSGVRIARYEPGAWETPIRLARELPLHRAPAAAAAWRYLRASPRRATDGNNSTLIAANDTPLVTLAAQRRELTLHHELTQLRLGEPLVRHGVIAWLAGELPWIGAWQPSLAVHVDDVLLASATWDASRDEPTDRREVRMTATHIRNAASWERRWRMPLDLAINGAGAHGDPCDPLLRELRARQQHFRLVNHTFTHRDLDHANAATITREILDNEQFARGQGLRLQTGELVTGGHTGLRNPALLESLSSAGIRVVGTDASEHQTPDSPQVSWVPRLPLGLAYDAPTIALQLDEWEHVGHPACTPGGCLDETAAWRRALRFESDQVVSHALAGDSRPFYAHQANLAGDATLTQVLERALRMVRGRLATPLAHPSVTEVARARARLHRAAAALARGTVRAQRTTGGLLLSASAPVAIPVTQLTARGERVRWVRLTPHRATLIPAPSRNRGRAMY